MERIEGDEWQWSFEPIPTQNPNMVSVVYAGRNSTLAARAIPCIGFR